jgi:ParB-like chromosome segregation protein Spo0J
LKVVPLVRISEVLANPLANAEAHLDDERVRSYIENSDQPPVVVFETDEGLLLVDGYHRVAAARARGEVTVDAETRSGSHRDALRYAAANGASQRSISVNDALLRIQQRSQTEWDGDT